MSTSIGSRIGPYEVVGKLGEGGMGEVFRARDVRLNREVALKLLTEAVIAEPDRIARFQREAQVLASLVGRFYDVSHDGQRFVVIKSPAPKDLAGAAQQTLVVVANWIEELKARVSGK